MPTLLKTNKTIRLGTRGSRLALAQAEIAKKLILKKAPSAKVVVVPIKTSGDKSPRNHLGKGLFIKEIEIALTKNKIDAAVHSLKDVPAFVARGLQITAYLKRDNSRDVFISRKFKTLRALPKGASVGTSSPRRAAFIRLQRPDLKIVPFRGNVETRLKKLEDGVCDATILAAAGLKRLHLNTETLKQFNIETLKRFVPAIGQGTICIETRKSDEVLNSFIRSALNHPPTEKISLAERNFLQIIGGDCHTPIAAHATLAKNGTRLTGFVAEKNGRRKILKSLSGRDFMEVSSRLAKTFLRLGARKIVGLPKITVLHTGLNCDKGEFPSCRVIHLPLIKIKNPSDHFKSLDGAIARLNEYDWIVFTSQNAARVFFSRLDKKICAKIAVVGEKTAETIEHKGFKVAIKPAGNAGSAGLAEKFRGLNVRGKKILYPRAKDGLNILPESLKKQGAVVDIVEAYRTEFVRVKRKIRQPDIVVFTSQSTIKSFIKNFGRKYLNKARIIWKTNPIL